MKNREKEQQRGRENKLAMIHIKQPLEGCKRRNDQKNKFRVKR